MMRTRSYLAVAFVGWLAAWVPAQGVVFAQSTKHKAQSTKHKAQSTKHKAQSTKHKAQSTKHKADLVASESAGLWLVVAIGTPEVPADVVETARLLEAGLRRRDRQVVSTGAVQLARGVTVRDDAQEIEPRVQEALVRDSAAAVKMSLEGAPDKVEAFWRAHEKNVHAHPTFVGRSDKLRGAVANLCMATAYGLRRALKDDLAIARVRTCSMLAPDFLYKRREQFPSEFESWVARVHSQEIRAAKSQLELVYNTGLPGMPCSFLVQGRPVLFRKPIETAFVVPGSYEVELECKPTEFGPGFRQRKLIELGAMDSRTVVWDAELIHFVRLSAGAGGRATNDAVTALRYEGPYPAAHHLRLGRKLVERVGATQLLTVGSSPTGGVRVDWYRFNHSAMPEVTDASKKPRDEASEPLAFQSAPVPLAGRGYEHAAVGMVPGTKSSSDLVEAVLPLMLERKSVDHRSASMQPMSLPEVDAQPWPWASAWGSTPASTQESARFAPPSSVDSLHSSTSATSIWPSRPPAFGRGRLNNPHSSVSF
jgi:hypothetical protein